MKLEVIWKVFFNDTMRGINTQFQFKIITSLEDFSRDGSTLENALEQTLDNLKGIEISTLYTSVLNEEYVIKDGEIKEKETIYETTDRDTYNENKESDSYKMGSEFVYDNMHSTATMSTMMYPTTTTLYMGQSNNLGYVGYGTPLETKHTEYHDVPEKDLPIYRKIRILLDINLDINEVLPHQAVKLIREIIEAEKDIINTEINISCKRVPKTDLREKFKKDMIKDTYELSSKRAHFEYELDKDRTLIERVSFRMRKLKP